MNRLCIASLAGGALALAPTLLAQGHSPVVINEFNYDDSGTDDYEFCELFNTTAAPVAIGDWHLDGIDDNGGPDNVATIPAGTVLAPGDYYVIGMIAVPNLDLDITANADWQNDLDALVLYDDVGRIVDAVVYETNKGPGAVTRPLMRGGDGIWGNFTAVEATGLQSWSRLRDGYDTGRSGYDFRLQPATPGTTNGLPAAFFVEDFEAAAIGSSVADWGATFAAARVIDPTTADGSNPNTIAASPEGGHAAVFWDSSGGGNSNMLLCDPCPDLYFEAWVYIESAPLGDPTVTPGEHEVWSIGFGTTDTFYNAPDPSGTLGAGYEANGNTGVAWTYQRLESDGSARLYLYDHNDGGWGANAVTAPTLLGSVDIYPGVNDGWQRLRLQIVGGHVQGYFTGGYGATGGGVLIAGWVRSEPRAPYVGYREFVADNTTTRPLTLDRVTCKCSPPASVVYGCATGYHSLGGPALNVTGTPRIGATFTIEGRNIFGVASALMFGFATPPLPIPGSFPGAALCIDPFFAQPTTSFPTSIVVLPVPYDPAVSGIPFDVQWLDWDPTTALPLPIGTSDTARLVVGS